MVVDMEAPVAWSLVMDIAVYIHDAWVILGTHDWSGLSKCRIFIRCHACTVSPSLRCVSE